MNVVNAITVQVKESTTYVGVPVKALIDIETSFYWDEEAEEVASRTADGMREGKTLGDGHPSEDQSALEDVQSHAPSSLSPARNATTLYLSVDVQCDSVQWLLVGTKRVVIPISIPQSSKTAHPKLKNSISLTLVALQSGRLSLPSVSIWPLTEPLVDVTPASHAHRSATALSTAPQGVASMPDPATVPACDSFMTNEAEPIYVLPRHMAVQSSVTGEEIPRETYWVSM